MAQPHIPKDPSNQSSLAFARDPLTVKTHAGYRNKKREIILQFLYNLKKDMIYRRIK